MNYMKSGISKVTSVACMRNYRSPVQSSMIDGWIGGQWKL